MPHKHKRLKTTDPSQYDLAPSSKVRPLPVKHGASVVEASKKRRARSKAYQDDTPKEFARLMQFKKTGKRLNGLDNGRSSTGKRKRDAEATDLPEDTQTSQPTPKIQPGERLRDFAARVDQALPIAGLVTKNMKVDGVREHRQTKHEKKLQRLVNNWKAEEARRIEKAEEEWEEAEEKEEEDGAIWGEQVGELEQATKKGKRGKRKGSDDEDPWAVLKAKRDRPKGIFDVVQAPPQFGKMPKEFKVKEGAKVRVSNVPNLGSLRRQEIMSDTRQDVINRYREMMQAKRSA